MIDGRNQNGIFIKKITDPFRLICDLKYKISKDEIPRPWTIAAIAKDKVESLNLTTTHELGHYRHYKTIGEKEHFPFNVKESVSEYGRTNRKEYFAEWFTYYRKNGEEGVPKPMLELFKKIDNGK